ncbi:MAG: ABC1 kinase family protein, partial [Acidimicrobiales bacterium]
MSISPTTPGPPEKPEEAPGDLAHGAFSHNAPWEVDPNAMAWRRGNDALRVRVANEVPSLLGRRCLPPLGRMVRVALGLGRAMGSWWLLDKRRGQHASRAGLARRLRLSFQGLGPTYIKLGQILSSGEGIFP